MSQVMLVALAAFLVYLALRVVRMKRRSLPFVIAYPVFVLVFLGGSVATFVAAGHGAVRLGLQSGDPQLIVAVYGTTALAAVVLWFVARRLIG
jgi:hypothetical protein